MIRRIVKLSLATSVALSTVSTLQAKDLSEAIKGVDVSGTVVYRYNDYGDGDASGDTENNYKIGLSLSSPINEDVQANTRFLVADTDGDLVSRDTKSQADKNFDVTLSQVNFQYTGLANTSIYVGKQGLATPWTKAIDSDGFEQTGTGILGMTTFENVTAAAGMFNQTNLDTVKIFDQGTGVPLNGSKDLIVAGLMANFGLISAEAWYLDLDDVADSYFVKATAKFKVAEAKMKIYAQYSDLDAEDSVTTNDDHNLTKAGISAKMGQFDASFAYATSGDDGAGVLNKNAAVTMNGWNVSINDHYDADMYQIDLGMKVTPKLHIGLNYDKLETADAVNKDETDMFVQATYKMSKNLKTYVRFGNYKQENQTPEKDGTRGRLQVQYSF